MRKRWRKPLPGEPLLPFGEPEQAVARPAAAPAAPPAPPPEIEAPAVPVPALTPPPAPDQAAALELDKNQVISASAGTGKTYTLAGIYRQLLCGSERREALGPLKIVAVTFTEKAAAELRQRIRAALDEMLAGPLSQTLRAHLKRCREDLPFAPIATIHGFCNALLRGAGAREGVPAAFTVLEEEDARELLEEALTQTAAEFLERDDDPALRALAEDWGVSGYHGYGLIPAGRTLIRALRTRGLAFEDLPAEPSDAEALDEATRQLAAMCAYIRGYRPPERKRSKPDEALLAFVESDPAPKNLEEARATAFAVYDRCMTDSGSLQAWAKEDGVRIEALLADVLVPTHAPSRAALRRYASAALARFTAEKRRLGALDFDDLLLEARRLLREQPWRARGYEFVLIDEYQDTNPVQRDILFAIAFRGEQPAAGGPVRLAVVGDVKQSIYRFRGADVTLMGEALRHLAVRPLRTSFRSRKAVLDWINAFSREGLWQAEGTGLLYDADHELTPAPQAARHACHAMAGEILSAPPADEHEESEKRSTVTRRWEQAQAIARRIRRLVDPGATGGLARPAVWDKDAFREQIRYGDIAILARSLKHMRLPLELALSRLSVPFRMLGGVSFYTRQEVLDVLNLLACVADPSDRAALLGFLRSPLVHLSDGGAYRVMDTLANAQDVSTWIGAATARLDGAEREAFQRACTLLERLRSALGRATIAETIDAACVATGFLAILAMRPQGEVAVAAVRRLIEKARDYESRGAKTLGDFVAWLREKADREWEEPGSEQGGVDLTPDLPATTDAVHIGTIHSAKGLEFPIVIVADLGHEPPAGGGGAAAFSEAHGLGLRLGLPREGLRARPDGILRCILEAEKAADEQELRRMLYVAVTRARDYLILAGEARTQKPTMRLWADEYRAAALEKGLPRLSEIPYNHPALTSAEADRARGPLELGEAEPVVHPPKHPPLAEELAHAQQLLAGYAQRPPRAGGTPRRAEVAVSELARFLSCPRRWALERASSQDLASPLTERDEAAEPADEDTAASPHARALGIAAHAALQAAMETGRADAAQAAWECELAGTDVPAADAASAFAALQAVLRSAWAKSVLALPPSRRHAERPLRWRVDLGPRGAVTLSGILDLLVEHAEGGWQVVDYKLAALPANDADGEALARYAWQVSIYALAASLLQEEPAHPALLFLREPGAVPMRLNALPLGKTTALPLNLDTLRQAAAAFLDAHAVSHADELPAQAWPPCSPEPVPRDASRCARERCPFVPRCFPG